jgi:pyruvate/2-oxoglutarate dehydrogenase complex dihydrolipoamide dehydrogenase (E3) component
VSTARVVIVGAGPAGIGVAAGLGRLGIRNIVLIERADHIGGIPTLYGAAPGAPPSFGLWRRGRILYGTQYSARLRAKLRSGGADIWLRSEVISICPAEKTLTIVNPEKGRLDVTADAFVLACGARERTLAERGWISGARPGGVLFARHLLEGARPRRAALVGSGPLAYAAAALLRGPVDMLDQRRAPACPFATRLYLRPWTRPRYHATSGTATLLGGRTVTGLRWAEGALACERLLLCGELIPNSELALLSGLDVELPDRRLVADARQKLSVPGWFAAGNILGPPHGAEWCHRQGRRVAVAVAESLA